MIPPRPQEARSPPSLPAGREAPSPENPSRPRFRPFQPRGRTPGPPACFEQPPGAPPARSARRSPRGGREGAALTSPGAGCGRGSRLQAPYPPLPHSAPLAPTAASPVLATATFIFLNYIGRKAKAKTAERRARSRARSEHRERAGSQRRGLRAAQGQPSGVGAGDPSTREAGAGQQAGRPDSKRTGPHASVCRDASPRP